MGSGSICITQEGKRLGGTLRYTAQSRVLSGARVRPAQGQPGPAAPGQALLFPLAAPPRLASLCSAPSLNSGLFVLFSSSQDPSRHKVPQPQMPFYCHGLL